MDTGNEIPREELHAGLKKIRLRRWFLWLLIIAYLPLMMLAMRAEQSARAVVSAFVAWVVLLIVAVALMALARCPRCGNCFHMSGFLFRPVRRCFSCGLPLSADKKIDGPS
jgi:FtsH-binding integral membrane protein